MEYPAKYILAVQFARLISSTLQGQWLSYFSILNANTKKIYFVYKWEVYFDSEVGNVVVRQPEDNELL